MSNKPEIKDIMKLLADSNKKFESSVYVPSINKEVVVKPMTASHLKDIIESSLNGAFLANRFSQTLFKVIGDIFDPSIPLTKVNVFDKLFIVLFLRKKNVDSTISVQLTAEVDGEQKTITEKVSIDDILERAKNTYDFSDRVVSIDGFSATINFPTIFEEYIFNYHFDQTRLKKMDENNKDDLKTLIGPIFMNEIAQFIKDLTIEGSSFNVSALSVPERLAILESIPTKMVMEITNSIRSDFDSMVNDALSIKRVVDKIEYIGRIELTPELFT